MYFQACSCEHIHISVRKEWNDQRNTKLYMHKEKTQEVLWLASVHEKCSYFEDIKREKKMKKFHFQANNEI